jgi:hypothetical protein
MDGGQINVKNVDQPIRIWRWTPDAVADGERDQCASLNAGNSRPHAAIAVLPFTKMSGILSGSISPPSAVKLSSTQTPVIHVIGNLFAYPCHFKKFLLGKRVFLLCG